MWLAIQKNLQVNIASVEYRKSPEHQYMDALEDAYDASIYLQQNAAVYGFDPQHISVIGFSAGACLAATLCIYAKEKRMQLFERQILLYPFLDSYTDPDAKGEGSLSGPIMYLFNELHSKSWERSLPLVSPVFASRALLTGLPPAIIIYAEDDNLKHEGMKYSKLMRAAGVHVDDMLAEQMPHGYFEFGYKEGSYESATTATLSFIKKHNSIN